MKILAFSDLHRDTNAAKKLCEASIDADILIGAGDFATKGKGGLETLRILAESKAPVILVHGNHDSPSEVSDFCTQSDKLIYLHGTMARIEGLIFFGLGGEIPSRHPEKWNSFETEEHASKMLESCPKNAVLITHTPPYGVVDLQTTGKHEGSTAILEAISKVKPRLHLCGHIHRAWGTSDKVGETIVHNLGPTLNWFEI
ncbi:MAG: metallophosphoesterase [Chloroflexota bacterium]